MRNLRLGLLLGCGFALLGLACSTSKDGSHSAGSGGAGASADGSTGPGAGGSTGKGGNGGSSGAAGTGPGTGGGAGAGAGTGGGSGATDAGTGMGGRTGTGGSGDMGSGPRDAGADAPPRDAGLPGASEAGAGDASGNRGDAAPFNDTDAQLEAFWRTHGGRATFPAFYVAVIETVVRAEDDVLNENYAAARVRLDAVLAQNPLGSDVWWNVYWTGQGRGSPHPYVGEPGAYAATRMLHEIAAAGLTKPASEAAPIQMTIIMPACSNIVPRTGPTLLNHPLNPAITEGSHRVVRQSLRLFQSYILAITKGALRLELNFAPLGQCFEINARTGFVVGNYTAPIRQLPAGVDARTDMYWLIYPSASDAGVDVGQAGGMGAFGKKPVFISDADFLIKKGASNGGGPLTDVERRVYLPEWLQHEFFHHLFRSWPELGLEKTDHQWFTRSTWPPDFVGKHEEDYYAEALNKRLYTATPSIAEILRQARPMP